MATTYDTSELAGLFAQNSKVVGDLLKRATSIQTKISKSQEVKDGITQLNEISGRRPMNELLGSAESTGKKPLGLSEDWYNEMLSDNQKLKETLSKFQSGTDLIMAKHRSQTLQLVSHVNNMQSEADLRVDEASRRTHELELDKVQMSQKMEKMLQIMSLAVTVDNENAQDRETEMTKLQTENEGLRQLLGIAGIPQPGFEDEKEEEGAKQT